MRVALIVLSLVSVAHADTSVWIGGGADVRGTASSYGAVLDTPGDTLGMGRLTLSLADAPPAMPSIAAAAEKLGLAAEVLAGFDAGHQHLEGYAGVGVRGQIRIARRRPSGFCLRAAFYFAARGMLIGAHQDRAGELAIGLNLGSVGGKVVGIEEGVMFRPRTDMPDHPRELDANLQLYLGW